MSVEGLLSEVTSILGSRLAIRAADQAFFGGKQVYTDVSATTSHSVDSNLSSEIAQLKLENKEIKDELAQLRKLVEQLSVSGAKRMFENAQNVLIMGDGNLSFARSFASLFASANITASVLEDRTTFLARYDGQSNVDHLLQCSNVDLLFGIDATKLPLDWYGRFDTIIMNFPHHGGKSNLKRSRILAQGLLKSIRSIMDDRCAFYLSLASGQSGFEGFDNKRTSEPPVHKKDSWQIIYLAASEGMKLVNCRPMFPNFFPGYSSAGYRTTKKGFDNYSYSQNLVFKKCDVVKDFDSLVFPLRSDSKFFNFLPYHQHDVSFLYDCPSEEIPHYENEAFKMISELTGRMVVKMFEVKELRSMCPSPYLANRIYRIYWQSIIPIDRSKCTCMQDILRERIVSHIAANKLPLILT